MPRTRNPLIPLPQIPDGPGRRTEADARRGYHSWRAAAEAARYQVVVAEGFHSEEFPPVVGWVLTLGAATALASRQPPLPSAPRLAFVRVSR
jgi:hypothetical protein